LVQHSLLAGRLWHLPRHSRKWLITINIATAATMTGESMTTTAIQGLTAATDSTMTAGMKTAIGMTVIAHTWTDTGGFTKQSVYLIKKN
jgi:hypothetical protein